ncbi:MAG TPA: serine/threonine-protein kinase [Gemmatales bacterium]|nr:serine/threonine-protein kinase [Gemmatales bacterium]
MNKQPPSSTNTEPGLNEATVQIISDQSDISDQPTIAGTSEAKPDVILDKLPTLPGYSITGVLGRGGMGVVYEALQRPLNRPVALKMIISGEHAGAEDRLRFLAEAESIAKIQHPGIVQLYEFGSHEGHPYFALEYVTGGTLEKKLSGTPLPPREAAILIEKLARAMQAAHDLGIVHRDLKPANILLTPAGEPKITDFGLAKSGGSNLTATGAILGTPSYMAPEQADGQKTVGALADLYALGAILYECLTGRPPFKGPTHVDTILQVVNNEPVSVRNLQATTPQDLETICHKSLAKEPAKRYATMSALAEDLRRYLHNEPIDARPVGRVEKAWRWCRRNPLIAGLVGSLTLLLLTVAIASLLLSVYVQGKNSDLNDAIELSQKNEHKAQNAAEVAKRERDKSKALLSRQYSANASRQIEEGDPTGALLWTAQAIKETDGDPEQERLHRIQFNELLKRQPRPLGTWEIRIDPEQPSRLNNSHSAFFSADGRIAMIPSKNEVVVLDLIAGKQLPHPALPKGTLINDAVMSRDGKTIYALVQLQDEYHDKVNLLPGMFGTAGALQGAIQDSLQHGVSVLFSHSVLMGWDTLSGRTVFQSQFVPKQPNGVSLQLSRNGKRILAGATVYDTTTGKMKSAFQLPERENSFYCLNHDGSEVMVCSVNYRQKENTTTATCGLWDVDQGRWKSHPIKVQGDYQDSGFTEDGTPVLVCGSEYRENEESFIDVWNLRTGQRIMGKVYCKTRQGKNTSAYQARLSPDKARILLKGSQAFSLWDIAGKKMLFEGNFDELDRDSTEHLATYNDVFLASSRKGTIDLFDLTSKKKLMSTIRNRSKVSFAGFSPYGNVIALADDLGTVELIQTMDYGTSSDGTDTWNSCTYRTVAKISHSAQVHHVEFAFGGRYLMTFMRSQSDLPRCVLWDLASLPYQTTPLRRTLEQSERLGRLFQNSDFALYVYDSSLEVLDIIGGKSRYSIQVDEEMNRSRNQWNPRTPISLQPHPSTNDVRISPDQKHCLLLRGNVGETRYFQVQSCSLFLCSLQKPDEIFELARHPKGSTTSACFSDDGKYCSASFTIEGNQQHYTYIYLWDVFSGKQIGSRIRIDDSRAWCRFSGNSQELMVFYHDAMNGNSNIRYFQSSNAQEILRKRSSFELAYTLYQINSPPSLFLTGLFAIRTTLWNEHHLEKPNLVIHYDCNSFNFSPDGKQLATARGNRWDDKAGEARVWDVENGLPLSPVIRYRRPFDKVCLLDGKPLLLTVSNEETANRQQLILWSVSTGQMIVPPYSTSSTILDLQYDVKTNSVVILFEGGSVARWEIRESVISAAQAIEVAEAISGTRIDATGSIQALSSESQAEKIRQARNTLPEYANSTKASQIAWYTEALEKDVSTELKLSYLSRLIQLEPESVDYRTKHTLCLVESGKFAEAVDGYTWLIERKVDLQKSLIARGLLHANDIFSANLEKKPEEARRHLNLGLNDLEQSLKLGPIPQESHVAVHWMNWGVLLDRHAGEQRWTRCRQLEDQLAKSDSNYRESEVMALAVLRAGKVMEAKGIIEKTIERYAASVKGIDDASRYMPRYGVDLITPVIKEVWGNYHPNDLLVKALIEMRLGQHEEARKAVKLLRILLLNPAHRGLNLTELNSLVKSIDLTIN